MTPDKRVEKYGEWDIEVDGVMYAGKRTLTQYHQDMMSELAEKLEGMKEDGETPFGSQELHETEVAYNKALTEAQTIIKSK